MRSIKRRRRKISRQHHIDGDFEVERDVTVSDLEVLDFGGITERLALVNVLLYSDELCLDGGDISQEFLSISGPRYLHQEMAGHGVVHGAVHVVQLTDQEHPRQPLHLLRVIGLQNEL